MDKASKLERFEHHFVQLTVAGFVSGVDPCPALGKSGHRIEFLALGRKGRRLG